MKHGVLMWPGLADWVRSRSGSERIVVLIDGGSGAGKTSLAIRLADELDAHLVSLDAVYPGWHGLASAQQRVPGIVRGEGHPTWDWVEHRTNGWVDTPPDGPLVIEGCGTLTPTNVAWASATVWCQLDEVTRKQRALDRDGDAFAPWWETWAEQEREHWRRHRPWELANLVLPMGL